MNRINLITLGVDNLVKSRYFYTNVLGMITSNIEDNPSIVFFNNNGTKLALYNREMLSEDINQTNPPKKMSGFSGITLAHNCESEEEVKDIFSVVEKFGGKIVKQPQKVSWGGFSGYFQDPDGHYWEVAYGPMWEFDENKMLIIR